MRKVFKRGFAEKKMPEITDRLMFCGERTSESGSRSRVISGYIEVERTTGKIVNGRYLDSADNLFRVKSQGHYNAEILQFTIVSDSGWTVEFDAKRKTGLEYRGKVEGPKYNGSISLSIKRCSKDIHEKDI